MANPKGRSRITPDETFRNEVPHAGEPPRASKHDVMISSRVRPPTREERLLAWESAVEVYGTARDHAERAPLGDVTAAADMAAASAAVAYTWRELLALEPLPPWTATAVLTAANVFEEQADTWHAREARASRAQPEGRIE